MTATAKGFYTNKAREETQKREYEALMAALRALYGVSHAKPGEEHTPMPTWVKPRSK